MNKETRTFILGMLFFFVGIVTLSRHIIRLSEGILYNGIDWCFFTASLICLIIGAKKLHDTTD